MKFKNKSFKRVFSTIIAAIMLTSILTNLPINTLLANASNYSDLDSQAYSGDDLGAIYTPTKTSFKVWAPTASDVKLKLYKTGSDSEPGAGVISTTQMTKGSQAVWSVDIQGDIKNTYYTYLVTVNGRTNEAVDIYAHSGGVNGNRGMVIDLDSTDPSGWNNDKRVSTPNQTDSIVWEGHVRDFSAASNSGISSKNKGKFLAFTEKGTTVDNDGVHKTGVDYLKELGITHVQLLPIYDYATVDETKNDFSQYNWGYDPKNYNMPEGGYSTNPYDGNSRVKELKQAVQSLHNENIGVIMDVVYNHLYEGVNKDNATCFNLTVPGYYYRQNADGSLANGSACGNETASDRAMYQKFMIDSLVYWAKEYHIDGFRFDLMGLHDVDTMNKIREALDKVDPNIIIYGEPWNAGSTASTKPTAVQGNMYQVNSEVGAFNDKIRDAIKGSCFNKFDKGFVQGASGFEESIKAGVQANATTMAGKNKWSKQPSQTVTYTSAHDNYTLYDKLITSTGKGNYQNRYDDVVAMNRLSASIVLTSQGISFMQAGEEFARSKNGDENSYMSSTNINQLDWERTKTYSDLVSYYKGLIDIRKAYSPFRDPSNTTNGTIYFSWGTNSPANTVAFTMQNKLTSSTEWNYVGVAYNANDSARTINLQGYGTIPSQWVIIAKGDKAGVTSLGTTGSTIEVPARSTVIVVDKESYDAHPVGKNGTVIVKHIDSDTGAEITTAETKTGKAGTSYTTSPATVADYNLSKTPTNASGTFTEGTTTVTYEYKKDNTPKGTVTVKYLDKDTKQEISSSKILTGKFGESYTVNAIDISKYILDKTTLPNNASGTYKEGNQVVTFYYNKKQTKNLLVHYYNPSWTAVKIYAYDESTGTTKKFSGEWPGTNMTSEGDGWWSYEVSDVESGQVIFSNGSQQEPGSREPGYKVEGEVWIQDKKVLPEDPRVVTGKVTVKYIDQDTNNEIAPAKTLSGNVGTSYALTPLDIEGYSSQAAPYNAIGSYTKEDITVVFKYKKTIKLNMNNFVTNLNSPQSLVPITLTATGTGTGILKYKFIVNDGIRDTVIQDYSINNSKVWIPEKSGIYTLKAYLTDETGEVVSKQLLYVINGPLKKLEISSFVANVSSPQNVGTEIVLSTISTGGEGVVQTKFAICDGKEWKLIRGYSAEGNVVWKPTKAGIYQIDTTVKDEMGNTAKKTINYIVNQPNDELKMNSFNATATSDQDVSAPIILSTNSIGGRGTLQTKFAIFDGSKWKLLKGYSTDAAAVWIPEKAGIYQIDATVKDESGNISRKSITYVVKDNMTKLTITDFSASLQSPQNAGTSITLNTISTGGKGTCQTKFAVFDGVKWSLIKDYSAASNVVWKPSAEGNYQINATVKDEAGNISMRSMTYKVTNSSAQLDLKVNVSLESPQALGSTIILKTEITGGVGIIQSRFIILDGASVNLLQDYSNKGYTLWKPTKAGVYTIIVSVNDETGKQAYKTVNYVIK